MSPAGDDQPRQFDLRMLSVVVFATFFAWLLAFPFEGQVLYAITGQYDVDPHRLILGAIVAHLAGLCCGSLIKTMRAAKNLMLYSIVFCIAGSAFFFFAPSFGWNLLLPASLLAGSCVAAWGFYFQRYTPSNQRLHTAAEGLIYSNLLMILLNMMATQLLPEAGLTASMVLLVVAFFVTLRLPEQPSPDGPFPAMAAAKQANVIQKASLGKPLGLLCLFIVVITINSGLMYRVINPAFSHLEWLVSWYWAVPYIVALQIMKRLPRASNRAHILYVAIAMIGFAFIFYMILDRSAAAYLVVDTLMLGACGVFDLFWWSILGEVLDLTENPARLLGLGLAGNVLGVLLGGILGTYITARGFGAVEPAVVALGVVLVTMIILPALHQQLIPLLRNHAFLVPVPVLSAAQQPSGMDSLVLAGSLTERERQVVDLLCRGRTYKMIADELYLSENTVKTYIKSIYSKLGIQSKAELVRLLTQLDDPTSR